MYLETAPPQIADENSAALRTALAAAQREVAALREQLSAERAAKERLRWDLELRTGALDVASSHFMIIDCTQPDSLRIVFVNRCLAKDHGYEPEDLVGRKVSDLKLKYRSESERERLLEAMMRGETARCEAQAVRRDGSTFWLGFYTSPLRTGDGRITHYVTVGADITARLESERRKAELQEQLVSEMRERERIAIELRLAQKLESVGRLAAGMAHEINTPIQYVGDSVYFLRTAFEDIAKLFSVAHQAAYALAEKAGEPAVTAQLQACEKEIDFDFLRQEVPKAFERTQEGVERVAGIVRAMKEFAHPDATEHSPADLNHALETTIIVARAEYKYSATLETDFEELPPVLCNVGELNQVFLNLIVNAGHAIHDSGKDAASGRITITTSAVDDWAHISIEDNGCGIPPENMDKIFDPFFTTKEVGARYRAGPGDRPLHHRRQAWRSHRRQQRAWCGNEVPAPPADRRTQGVGMKRVLFVDDETALLDGLRGRLRGMRDRWEMVFVESGARAVTEMELRAFDVIVADMRMPGMDGAQLLNVVSERWPETVRIVLSGYSDEGQSARLLTVAHQYLSKPCEVQQLENVVNRCIKLQALLTEPRLRAAVGRVRQLPALPRTYAKLRQIMEKGDATVQEVSAAISTDSAIAAKVLQIVNSAFFRLAKRVTRIEQAVTYLGFIAIRNLVMSVEVFSQWNRASVPAGFDPERLQLQAQRVAAIARSLASGSVMSDDAMLAGLLHNIGYCVLVDQCPAEIDQAARLARDKGIAMHEAEREVIGASHAEVGAYLLGIWGLPYQIIEAVAFQHTPGQIPQSEFDLLAVLATAETLALTDMPNAFGLSESVEGGIDERYLQSLQAPYDWLEAQRRATNALRELSV